MYVKIGKFVKKMMKRFRTNTNNAKNAKNKNILMNNYSLETWAKFKNPLVTNEMPKIPKLAIYFTSENQ